MDRILPDASQGRNSHGQPRTQPFTHGQGLRKRQRATTQAEVFVPQKVTKHGHDTGGTGMQATLQRHRVVGKLSGSRGGHNRGEGSRRCADENSPAQRTTIGDTTYGDSIEGDHTDHSKRNAEGSTIGHRHKQSASREGTLAQGTGPGQSESQTITSKTIRRAREAQAPHTPAKEQKHEVSQVNAKATAALETLSRRYFQTWTD
jgi:hypothetical protein